MCTINGCIHRRQAWKSVHIDDFQNSFDNDKCFLFALIKCTCANKWFKNFSPILVIHSVDLVLHHLWWQEQVRIVNFIDLISGELQENLYNKKLEIVDPWPAKIPRLWLVFGCKNQANTKFNFQLWWSNRPPYRWCGAKPLYNTGADLSSISKL